MNLLDVQDKIKAGQYRSDRFPAVPFKTLEDMMQEAQAVLSAETLWAGIITPSCGDHSHIETVSRKVGIGLRIGGEANLCFVCGPEGGYYHPAEGETMNSVMFVAGRLNVLTGDNE